MRQESRYENQATNFPLWHGYRYFIQCTENLDSQSYLFFQAVLLCGRKFIDEGHSSSDEIKARCDQLQENWDELKNLAEQRCV